MNFRGSIRRFLHENSATIFIRFCQISIPFKTGTNFVDDFGENLTCVQNNKLHAIQTVNTRCFSADYINASFKSLDEPVID